MPLKLNKLSDETIAEMLSLDFELLKENLSERPPDSAAPAVQEGYYERLGDLARDVAFMLYQQEKGYDEVLYYLRLAGSSLLRAYELRANIEPKECEKGPGDFEETLNIVVICCGSDERRRAFKIKKQQYCEPGESNGDRLVDYLEMLKLYLSDETIDQGAASAIEKYCLSNVAPREYQWFLLPKVSGLSALANDDRTAWQGAISQLIKAHESEALRGDNRYLTKGSVCLSALMLAKLGREHDFACDIASHYLPLKLLEP